MIEYGVVGGRCGCRSEQEVLDLARAIKAQPALALNGIEGYEGVIHGEHAVSGIREFAASLVRLAVDMQNSGAFDLGKPIITASGSAWYDLIAESFAAQNAEGRFLSVLRPGSYVAHDHGIYKEAQCCVLDRRSDLTEGLRPALEVWAHVQSLPQPGFAVIALGKRDVAYDAGLPVPDRATFLRDADWMGIQRHVKILGLFCRLRYRDNKGHYLDDAPRFITYLDEVLPRYRELAPLQQLLDERIKPALAELGAPMRVAR
ncbi:MAG: hypothetical protein E6861_20760, partial [Stenotrophomonas maltophilia]|nr:hypothetical protein [Stenotrophomonas maltophilia]